MFCAFTQKPVNVAVHSVCLFPGIRELGLQKMCLCRNEFEFKVMKHRFLVTVHVTVDELLFACRNNSWESFPVRLVVLGHFVCK
jgi:hypothetical protein